MEATGLRTIAYESALAYTRGITVDDLRAGYSKTSTIPLGRSGKLSEVADLCVYLASQRASYVHGVTVNVAGGKTKRLKTIKPVSIEKRINMKQLFNNENRIAVILKNIEMQSVCSVESLAAKLDVSQKTIRNDIKELELPAWRIRMYQQ